MNWTGLGKGLTRPGVTASEGLVMAQKVGEGKAVVREKKEQVLFSKELGSALGVTTAEMALYWERGNLVPVRTKGCAWNNRLSCKDNNIDFKIAH